MAPGLLPFLTPPPPVAPTDEEPRRMIRTTTSPIDERPLPPTAQATPELRRPANPESRRPSMDDGEPNGFAGIVGRHPSMLALYELLRRVAATDATVLVTGESGTGKEVIAQALHALSRRRGQRLVPVHCGAIPEELLESEMFGHEKGAFTGAIASRVGRFRMADGGTIFLDEIGEMSPKLQVKLLRVLEDGRFETVGGMNTQSVDVRVVAATNRDLEQAIADGRFREDLFYRLRVVPVRMPSLRERREDVPLLVDHFLRQLHATKGLPLFSIDDAAMACLEAYDWPGNVRELKNLLEQLVVLGSDDHVIRVGDLPGRLREAPAGFATRAAEGSWTRPPWEFDGRGIDLQHAIATIEDRIIARALDLSGGNKKEAARLLHLNRTTLLEKLKRKREKAQGGAAGEGDEAGDALALAEGLVDVGVGAGAGAVDAMRKRDVESFTAASRVVEAEDGEDLRGVETSAAA